MISTTPTAVETFWLENARTVATAVKHLDETSKASRSEEERKDELAREAGHLAANGIGIRCLRKPHWPSNSEETILKAELTTLHNRDRRHQQLEVVWRETRDDGCKTCQADIHVTSDGDVKPIWLGPQRIENFPRNKGGSWTPSSDKADKAEALEELRNLEEATRRLSTPRTGAEVLGDLGNLAEIEACAKELETALDAAANWIANGQRGGICRLTEELGRARTQLRLTYEGPGSVFSPGTRVVAVEIVCQGQAGWRLQSMGGGERLMSDAPRTTGSVGIANRNGSFELEAADHGRTCLALLDKQRSQPGYTSRVLETLHTIAAHAEVSTYDAAEGAIDRRKGRWHQLEGKTKIAAQTQTP